LAPNAQEADVIEACKTAVKYKVNSVNVNSSWIELVKKELAGSGVGPSAVIGFPYGACASKVKYFELEEMVKAGCTACDMVVNIGAVKDKNYALVTDEVKHFVDICGKNCDTKLIFEVGFLSDEDIAALTKIGCEQGVTYVKTATGSQGFPDIKEVKIMKANLSGKTKIKVSGVPRTFALPAAIYLFEHLGVGLIGTRSAGKLVQQYSEYLAEKKEKK
jgi:deoxyribose-phosphate aldolase